MPYTNAILVILNQESWSIQLSFKLDSEKYEILHLILKCTVRSVTNFLCVFSALLHTVSLPLKDYKLQIHQH